METIEKEMPFFISPVCYIVTDWSWKLAHEKKRKTGNTLHDWKGFCKMKIYFYLLFI